MSSVKDQDDPRSRHPAEASTYNGGNKKPPSHTRFKQGQSGNPKGRDLPLNFHPAALRASAGFTPWGAGGATCDRRSWSGLRRRSHVAERLAA
jgi:hypothetical protein